MKKRNSLSRRELILCALNASGGLALKSLVTGLPISFLTRRAMAADGDSYLVYSAQRAGDPVNCNVPGTYMTGFSHPTIWETAIPVNFGNQSYQCAEIWQSLLPAIRMNTNIFHLRTNTNGHGELDTVMNIFGSIKPVTGRAPEMLPSIISHLLSQAQGTTLRTPIAMSGVLTFEGNNQKIYTPNSLRGLFPSTVSVVDMDMRQYRDQQLDLVYADVKQNGTSAQKRFIDNYAKSRADAQKLGTELGVALSTVTGSGEEQQVRTAAALLALKVTPVATVGIGFGGDNHADSGLTQETTRHTSGISVLNTLYQSLASYGIHDKTTFAMLNVFGRTPNINSRGGRDHHGDSSIMLSFGPRVKGGVVGGLVVGGNRNRPQAQGINSVTGAIASPNINANETLHSAAKSLMVACGISEQQADQWVVGGKVVGAYTT